MYHAAVRQQILLQRSKRDAGDRPRYAPHMVVIRKYGNRRLYDTERSAYVNLEQVADRIRQGEEVRVEDARTGEDLTREILLQIVLEVQGGLDFLPVGLLRRIIRATGGDARQQLLRQQLATAFAMIHDQLDRLESQFPYLDPLAPLRGARPATAREPDPPAYAAGPPEPEATEPAAADADDLQNLRARLDALEKRLRKG